MPFFSISECCIQLVFPLSSDMAYTAEDVLKQIGVDDAILSVRQVEVTEFFKKYSVHQRTGVWLVFWISPYC